MAENDGGASKKEGLEVTQSASVSIVPEILEAVRQEGNQVNINILLQRVSEHEDNPDKMLEQTEKVLALAQKFEDHRLNSFQKRADAIIDVKTRDPDEIEKRNNNRARRCLKFVVAAGALGGFIGAGLCVVFSSSIVLAGMFATGGALSLAMLGPMATGESVSSNDVVRIVSAIRGALGGSQESQKTGNQQQQQRGKKHR